MKVPTSIKIAGRALTIKYPVNLVDEDGTELFGRTFPDDDLIEISLSRPHQPWQVTDTLHHEITHWVLGFTGQAETLGDQVEEGVCRALERLGEVYRLDPKACKWAEITFDFERDE